MLGYKNHHHSNFKELEELRQQIKMLLYRIQTLEELTLELRLKKDLQFKEQEVSRIKEELNNLKISGNNEEK